MPNNSKKHAYCIIAHNEPVMLNHLVEMIDDDRNDIFIMVDMKTDINIFNGIQAKRSNLYYTSRVDVRWGDISLIEAEMTLFESAFLHGSYQVYHLLSGVDLPIKSQDYIHRFIEEHPNTEFVGYAQSEFNKKDLKYKTDYYHYFTRYYRLRNVWIRKAISLLRKILILSQKIMRIHRTHPIELKKGVNWCSITNDFCIYLLEHKEEIMQMFWRTSCCDEMFLQSLLWNSPFRKNIYRPNKDFESCLRLIDWQRGNPYVWGSDINENSKGGDSIDFKMIVDSDALFARKFSSSFPDIISKVKKYVNSDGKI